MATSEENRPMGKSEIIDLVLSRICSAAVSDQYLLHVVRF